MQKYLIPKEGLLVRDPQSFNPLPVGGLYVDWSGKAGRYWRKRVKCGDASIVQGEKLEKLIKELADKKAKAAELALEEQEKDEEAASETISKRRSKK